MTWVSAWAGNRASKTGRYLQWWETTPEWHAVSPLLRGTGTTQPFCLLRVRSRTAGWAPIEAQKNRGHHGQWTVTCAHVIAHLFLRWEAIELQTMTPDRSAKGAVARKQADVLLMCLCTMPIRS